MTVSSRTLVARPLHPLPSMRPTDPTIAALPGRLREARETAHMTQRGLGELAGLSSSHVSKIEDGHKVPSLATVLRLAAALEIAPCWLAFGV